MPKAHDRTHWGGRPAVGLRTMVAQTCKECGLILGAKHFQKKRTSWSRICNSCHCRLGRIKYGYHPSQHEQERGYQAESLPKATRRAMHYTLHELDEITEALELGFNYHEIAVLVNRTYFAIHNVVIRYGLKNGWPTREVWVISFD